MYEPRLMHKIEYDFAPNNTVIYTLRGPRQVGKTTMIKLQIMRFLERGVCPWNIFYYSFDITESKSEVARIIRSYTRLSKRHKNPSRTYMFLDEITSVSDWQKGIKWLVDNNMLVNCTVLATGSQAYQILHATERLPGRRGRINAPYDMLLVPMKFSEFVSTRSQNIKKLVSKERLDRAKRNEILAQLSNKSIPKEIDLYNDFVDELDEHLREYALTGGTPKVVDEMARTGAVSSGTYVRYLDGTKSDWGDRNKFFLKQFVGAVGDSQCSATTWNALRHLTQIGSWSTVQDYALFLRDMATLTIVYKYGEKHKGPRFSQDKKLYFQDPFYGHMFRGWDSSKDSFAMAERFLADEANLGCTMEGIVADHLTRWAFALADNKMAFDYSNHVFFWKDSKGREVDFVLYKEDEYELPIEVKYRNSINAKQLGGLSGFLDQTCSKGGLVLSKDRLEERRDYLVVPASIFLALI